jgi:hypothetical protein
MTQLDNFYCKFFIDTSLEINELVDIIISFTNGRKRRLRSIDTDFCEIYVNSNEYFYSEHRVDGDFLYYKFFLDIEPCLNTTTTQYINGIIELMRSFRSIDVPTVPACDFEDALNAAVYNGT